VFLFFYGLTQVGLVGADEPRYAQVAREMLERHDWTTPVLGGQPWLEKPPLYYWQAMLAYSAFGVSDWAARLPAAVDATLLVLAVFFFLRRLRPGYELHGALITASTAGVVGLGRAAGTDMPLAAAFSVALIAWWTWRESGDRIYLIAFYALLGLGTLAKGPVAPCLAAAVIVIYALAVGDIRCLKPTLWLPGLLVFLLVAAPWFVTVQIENPAFFRTFILEHNLARFSTNMYHHSQPFWFYVPVALLALVPWTVFVVAAAVSAGRAWWRERLWRRTGAGADDLPEHGLSLFALIWLAFPLIFFSASQSKLPAYILPAIPAAGILLAEYLRHNVDELGNRRPPMWLAALHGLIAAAPVFPALLIQFLVRQRHIPSGKPAIVAGAIALGLAALVVLTIFGKLGLRGVRFATLIPAVLAVGAVLKQGAPIDEYLSARPLAAEIASQQPHAMTLAVRGVRREVDYGLAFYRNQQPVHLDTEAPGPGEYLLVVPHDAPADFPGRRSLLLGTYPPQHLDYYWILPADQSLQPR